MDDHHIENEDLISELNRLRQENAELKRSVEAAELRAKQLENIFDLTPVGLCLFDDQLRYTGVNNFFAAINGVAAAEHIGRTVREIVPDLSEQAEIAFMKVIETGEPLLNLEIGGTTLAEPGVHKYWNENWLPITDAAGKVTGILVTAEDITERKQAEEELRESYQLLEVRVEERSRQLAHERERLINVLETLPVNICLLTPEYKVPFANRAFRERFGESNGRHCYDYIFGYDEPCEGCRSFTPLETGQSLHWIYYASDGSILDAYDFPFTDTDGSSLILEMNIDITERVQAEDALRQSEVLFFTAFEMSPLMMSIVGMDDNRFIAANQNFLDTFEYSREELVGRTIWELNIFADKEDTSLNLGKLKEQNLLNDFETLMSTRSGNVLTILSSSKIVSLNGKKCRLVVAQDITAKKEMEANIIRLDRLNLIGEMAVSIGHEIRNPMTAVRGFLQMLGDKAEYQNDRGYFDIMIEELDRANKIISEYLGMARNKIVNLQPRSLDRGIKTIYPLIQSEANLREMRVKLDLSNPPEVMLDENEIRQLVLNMSRNALESMSSHGTMTIGTRQDGNEVILFIKDEGSGLSPLIMDKIGTPFNSTKENGTGLGLAICFSIALRHNARVDYETGPQGTTFFVRFPMPF